MKRWLISWTLTVVVAFAPNAVAQDAASDAGAQGTGRVPIVLWHSYRDAERAALEETVKTYNAAQDRIDVRLLSVPYDAFADKITATIPRGRGPDVFIFAHDRVGDWAATGHIAPIDDLLERGVEDRFFTQTVWALRYKGKLYGLPTAFKSCALFYNKALIKKPPADTTAMVEVAKKLTNENDGVFGLVFESGLFYFDAPWFFGFGGTVFDPDGKPVLNSPQNVAGLTFLRSLAKEHNVLPLGVAGYQITSMFNEGKAAMVVSGPWFTGEIAKEVDFGVALLPEVGASGKRATPFLSSEAFLISARSVHPREAVQVALALTSDAAALTRLTVGRQTVANIKVYEDPRVASDPVMMAFREQLRFSVSTPNTPRMRMVWPPLDTAVSKALNDQATPQAALDGAQHQIEQYIGAEAEGAALKETGDTGMGRFTGHLAIALLTGLGLTLATAFILRRRTLLLWRAVQRNGFAYLYATPALLAMLVLVFIPFAAGIGLGFFTYYEGEYYYVGLRNFIDIVVSREYPLTDPYNFYYKLGMTVLWAATNVTIHVVVGLGLALLLKDPLLKFKGVYRVLLIIPWAIPNYITAIIWRGMFDQRYGVINHLLGIEGFDWWANTWSAFLTNLITNAWLGFPFMMVVCLGALQSIPGDLYEAAQVDGASRWQQFRTITLPLLKPALFPAIILGTIWTFNMFNIIYLVSKGAPSGSTDILVSEAYRWAFERGNRYGYAAAYSTMIFLILLLYSTITNRITKATEGAYN